MAVEDGESVAILALRTGKENKNFFCGLSRDSACLGDVWDGEVVGECVFLPGRLLAGW